MTYPSLVDVTDEVDSSAFRCNGDEILFPVPHCGQLAAASVLFMWPSNCQFTSRNPTSHWSRKDHHYDGPFWLAHVHCKHPSWAAEELLEFARSTSSACYRSHIYWHISVVQDLWQVCLHQRPASFVCVARPQNNVPAGDALKAADLPYQLLLDKLARNSRAIRQQHVQSSDDSSFEEVRDAPAFRKEYFYSRNSVEAMTTGNYMYLRTCHRALMVINAAGPALKCLKIVLGAAMVEGRCCI